MASAEQLVLDLCDPELRENALLELSKKREIFQDLAPLLWNSYGTIAALLQEIISIYPALSPPTLSPGASNRVCNALALLQCVAAHADTRILFLSAHMPLYLYPFLNTTSKTRPFEYLRLTSLGVIGALVKVDDTEVISFLLQTEIIPLCLRTMEMGSELSKTVATFIVQKILLDDVGLRYICATKERFLAVGSVLGNIVISLAEQPSTRLLKHIIRCYLRLSDDPSARVALRLCLPDGFQRKVSMLSKVMEIPLTRRWSTSTSGISLFKGRAASPHPDSQSVRPRSVERAQRGSPAGAAAGRSRGARILLPACASTALRSSTRSSAPPATVSLRLIRFRSAASAVPGLDKQSSRG